MVVSRLQRIEALFAINHLNGDRRCRSAMKPRDHETIIHQPSHSHVWCFATTHCAMSHHPSFHSCEWPMQQCDFNRWMLCLCYQWSHTLSLLLVQTPTTVPPQITVFVFPHLHLCLLWMKSNLACNVAHPWLRVWSDGIWLVFINAMLVTPSCSCVLPIGKWWMRFNGA